MFFALKNKKEQSMNFIKMIKKGIITSWECKNAISFLWFVNLCFAVLIIHPYIGTIGNYFSGSAIVDLFMNKNFNLINNEFTALHPEAKGMLLSGVILAACIYFMLSIALNGGFIGLLAREKGYKVASLLRSGFGNYKYLLLIGLISVAGTILIISVGAALLFIIIKIFNINTEPGFVYTFIGVLSIMSIIYLLKEFLIDFMRIIFFRELEEGQSIHLYASFNKIITHIFQLFLFGVSMFVFLLFIYLISYFIGKIFGGINFISILLSFIWLQLTIYVRIFWRAAFWGGEVALLEGHMGGKITEKDLWPEDEIEL